MSFSVLVICHYNFDFYLKGDKSYTINLEEEFKEPGFKCNIFDYDLTKRVDISSNLDVKKVGQYRIKYITDLFGVKYEIIRNIKVIDSIKPEISLNGEQKISLNAGTKYTESGAKATDNYDGDLTDKISISNNVDTNKPGNYKVVYTVKDSSGNEVSITREVEVKKVVIKESVVSIDNSILDKGVVNDTDVINYIKNNNYKVSIGYYNLVDGSTFYYNKDKVYYGASLIKTVDALYLYEKNMVNDELKEHIKKTISVSNNESHKYLVNYIGKDNLKNYGISLGATNTLAGRDYYGNTTVNDQIIYMKKLYEITKTNNELKSFFINNYANYLKFNEINVMHKYGWYNQYFHESGIFLDSEPNILIVLSEHGNGSHRTVIKNISRLMYKYHINN